MTLRTNIQRGDLQTDHHSQHNEVNAAVLVLQGSSSDPPLVVARISGLGPTFGPLVTVPLVMVGADGRHGNNFAFDGGPYKVPPGRLFTLQVDGAFSLPAGATVAADDFQFEMFVRNADLTQALAVSNSGSTAIEGSGVIVPLSQDPGYVDYSAGSDLSITADGRMMTAAGGTFWITVVGQFSYYPAETS